MSEILIDVYDAHDNRLGDGPVVAISASVKRMLDGVGTIQISYPAHDERAVTLLAEERRIRIFIEQNDTLRELGRGIIRKRDYSASGNTFSVSASGPDKLDELKRRNVLINRAYNNMAVSTIATNLVGIVPGWSGVSTNSTLMSGRFDGSSVMKALQDLCKLRGLHFRQTAGANTVEIGTFGDTSPVTLVNTDQITEGLYNNDDIALIDSLKQSRVSEGVINRLFILGAGANVDTALTLAKSTRITPYLIFSAIGLGRTLYYIEDADSIAQYGVIERLVQFKEIAPLSNNETDVIRAQNALYDAAVAMLLRYKDPQESYTVSLKKCTQAIAPGDKVRLVYKEPVLRDDGTYTLPRDIDALFWVMSVSETVASGTLSTSLEMTSVDRYEDSIAKTLLGQLDQVRVQGALVQPTISHFMVGPEQVQIDPTHPATTQLIFTDATYSVERVLMRVRTRPFTSTATGAASGGGVATSTAAGGASVLTSTATTHEHLIMRVNDPAAPTTGLTARTFTVIEQTTGTLIYIQANTNAGATQRLISMQPSGNHTHDVDLPDHAHTFATPDHTHAMSYGIYTDTLRPQDLSISVNGVSVTPVPIGVSSTDLDVTLDITGQINAKVGGFQAVHDILIACLSGQGEVLISWDCYTTVTPFKFT